MIRLLPGCGFEIEDLLELRPAQTVPHGIGMSRWSGPGN